MTLKPCEFEPASPLGRTTQIAECALSYFTRQGITGCNILNVEKGA